MGALAAPQLGDGSSTWAQAYADGADDDGSPTVDSWPRSDQCVGVVLCCRRHRRRPRTRQLGGATVSPRSGGRECRDVVAVARGGVASVAARRSRDAPSLSWFFPYLVVILLSLFSSSLLSSSSLCSHFVQLALALVLLTVIQSSSTRSPLASSSSSLRARRYLVCLYWAMTTMTTVGCTAPSSRPGAAVTFARVVVWVRRPPINPDAPRAVASTVIPTRR